MELSPPPDRPRPGYNRSCPTPVTPHGNTWLFPSHHLVRSASKYLLSANSEPDTILGTGNPGAEQSRQKS